MGSTGWLTPVLSSLGELWCGTGLGVVSGSVLLIVVPPLELFTLYSVSSSGGLAGFGSATFRVS